MRCWALIGLSVLCCSEPAPQNSGAPQETLQEVTPQEPGRVVSVVVATRDFAEGEVLSEGALMLDTFDWRSISHPHFTSISDLENRVVVLPIKAGQPIYSRAIALTAPVVIRKVPWELIGPNALDGGAPWKDKLPDPRR